MMDVLTRGPRGTQGLEHGNGQAILHSAPNTGNNEKIHEAMRGKRRNTKNAHFRSQHVLPLDVYHANMWE